MRQRVAPVFSRSRRRGNNTPDTSAPRNSSPTPGDIVASTFANVDLRVTKAAMTEYAQRCETMSRENEMLRAQLQEHEATSVKVVQHLEAELQQAQATVSSQQSEITRLLTAIGETEVEMRQQYEGMLLERDEQLQQFAAITQRLQAELKAAAAHIHRREEYKLELQRLHDQLEEARTKHESDVAALRFQTVDRKMRLVALEETMREGFQAQVEAESARLLGAKSQALLEEHSALQQERVRLTQDIEELVQLTTAKNTECAEVRRRGSLHQRACEEALRRVVHGNRRARESEMKTQRLEQRVKELLHEKRSLREEFTRRYESQIQTLEKTLAETRSSLQWHRAELQRLRYIASTVVEQRSDLERFFYVALRDVRRMRSGNSTHGSKTLVASSSSLLSSTQHLPSFSRGDGNSNINNRTSPTPRTRLLLQQQQQQQQQHSNSQQTPLSITTSAPLTGISGTTFLTESQSNTSHPIIAASSLSPSPPSVTVAALESIPTVPKTTTINNTIGGSGVTPLTPDLPRLRVVAGGETMRPLRDVPLAVSTTPVTIVNSFNSNRSESSSNVNSKKNLNNNNNNIMMSSNVLEVNLGNSGDGAYLDDLSWDDKEKIIKALLFFINKTCYERLPGCQTAEMAEEDKVHFPHVVEGN